MESLNYLSPCNTEQIMVDMADLVSVASELTGHSHDTLLSRLSAFDIADLCDYILGGNNIRLPNSLSVEDEEKKERYNRWRELEKDRLRRQAMGTTHTHHHLLKKWGDTSKLSYSEKLFVLREQPDKINWQQLQLIKIVDAPGILVELARRYKLGDKPAQHRFSRSVLPLLREWCSVNGLMDNDQELRAWSSLQDIDPGVLMTYNVVPSRKRLVTRIRLLEIK